MFPLIVILLVPEAVTLFLSTSILKEVITFEQVILNENPKIFIWKCQNCSFDFFSFNFLTNVWVEKR